MQYDPNIKSMRIEVLNFCSPFLISLDENCPGGQVMQVEEPADLKRQVGKGSTLNHNILNSHWILTTYAIYSIYKTTLNILNKLESQLSPK